MEVSVVRSSKRRKTVEAREVGGGLELRIPARMSRAEERHWVEEMKRRFERAAPTHLELTERAARLAKRYGLPQPASIRWSARQRASWGSCLPEQGTIRISTALAPFPRWVLDYVIVHEVAHLVEHYHNDRFWELVRRYPKAERAEGYLMAKGMTEAGGGQPGTPPADQPTLW